MIQLKKLGDIMMRSVRSMKVSGLGFNHFVKTVFVFELQRDLTGVDNLKDVHFMEMKVDTRDTSLGNFGAHLPNLSQLKLSNSIITSVR